MQSLANALAAFLVLSAAPVNGGADETKHSIDLAGDHDVLAVTGGTGGLMSGETVRSQLAELAMVYLLEQEQGRMDTRALRAYRSIDGTYLLTLDQTAGPEEFSSVIGKLADPSTLEEGDFKVIPKISAPASSMVILEGGKDAGNILDFASGNKLFTAEKYTKGDMYVASIGFHHKTWLLFSGSKDPDIPEEITSWEARWSAYLARGGTKFLSFPQSLGGGPRRTTEILELKRTKKTILIDLGEALEGYSWVDFGRKNWQRKNSIELLSRLGYDAVCPGADDLAFGLDNYTRELSERKITILASNLVDSKDEHVFDTSMHFMLNGRKVRFFCFIGPDALNLMPPAQRPNYRVLSVAETLKRLDLERRPNEVFVAGFGPSAGKFRQELARLPQVFDIVVAPEHRMGIWLPGAIHERLDSSFAYTRNYVFPGRYTIGQIRLGPGHDEESWRVSFLNDDLEPDPGTLKEMMQVRIKALANEDRIILPDPTKVMPIGSKSLEDLIRGKKKVFDIYLGRGWEEKIEDLHALVARYLGGLVNNLVANVLVRQTGSDLAAIRPFGGGLDIPGPVTAGMLASELALPDKVVTAEVSGKVLLALFNEKDLSWSMADPVKRTVRGWPVDKRAVYTLATTDVVAKELDLEVECRLWTMGKSRLVPARDGKDVALSQAVIRYLDQASKSKSEQGYIALVSYLVSDHSKEKAARWTAEVSSLDVAAERTGIWKPGGFENVTDSRVGVQDLTRAQVFLKAAVSREAEEYLWRNTLKAQLGISITDGWDDRTEDSDDLVISSSLRYRLGNSRWIPRPYGSLTYDSEILAGDNPRQQVVLGDLGTVLEPGKPWPELGVSAFVSHDFVTSGTATRPGAGLFFRQRNIWGDIRLEDELEFRYYVPAGDETDDLLRLTLENRLGLSYLLGYGLSLKLFVNFFLFKGVYNEDIGHSWNWGSALSYTWMGIY